MTISEEEKVIISEEEKILDTVITSLDGQLYNSSQRLLKENKRSRALTSELVAAVQEEDKQLLASDEAVSAILARKKAKDIRLMEKLVDKPYFARFAVREEATDLKGQKNGKTQEMEYKLGFSANPENRIVDWRKAPVSKLYYEYQEGDEYCEEIQGKEREGEIILRNSLEIHDRKLVRISCREGNFSKENDNWKNTGQFIKSRSMHGSSYAQLPSIVSLITPEQFELITEDAETALLVQGIAGSGKTTVALHRLAWLLHEDNSDLQPEDCIVVVLSKILKNYVSLTLPSMEVDGVRVLTFHEWVSETLKNFLPDFTQNDHIMVAPDRAPLAAIRVKQSMAFMKSLEEYETAAQDKAIKALETELDWKRLPSGIRRAYESALKESVTKYQAIVTFSDSVNRGLQNIDSNNSLYPAMQQAAKIIEDVLNNKLKPETSIMSLLENPTLLREKDEHNLMTDEVIQTALKRTIDNFNDKLLDHSDEALFMRLYQLRYKSLRMRDGSSGKYGHIVVDEVQDLSPVALAAIIDSVPETKNLTLVGDSAQKIDSESVFPGWSALMKEWNFHDSISRYVSLTVSHRSTMPIMRLGDFIQKRAATSQGRKGRAPIWFKCLTESKGVETAISWLTKAQKRYPGALTAVICASPKEVKYVHSLLAPTFGPVVRIGDENSFSFAEGIVVTDILKVKGLEFMNVMLWNPNRKKYPDHQHARNLLYVAVTRAEENLSIVTWGQASTLLPHIHSKLIRGIDYYQEEIEQISQERRQPQGNNNNHR